MKETSPLHAALDRSHRGETGAWHDFTVLHDQALQTGDAALALQAAAGAVVTGQTLWLFDRFAELAAALQPAHNEAAGLDATGELLTLNGLLLGLLEYHPHDARTAAVAKRLLERVEQGLDVNLTLAAARTLIFHFDAIDQHAGSQHLHRLISARSDEAAATPYRVGQWLNLWWRRTLYGQQPRMAEEAITKMRTLAQRHGLRRLAFSGALAGVDIALPTDDAAAALVAIAEAETLIDHCELSELSALDLAKSRLARLRGQADVTRHHAARARALALVLKLPPSILSIYVINEAQALLHCEDYAGARTALLGQIDKMPTIYAEQIEDMVQGIDVCLAVQQRRPDADAQLAALWRLLCERRRYDLFIGFPAFCAKLCVMALERGLEIDFVRSLIVQCRLAAPPGAPANWPWPLRIHALGGFVVWRDDVLLGTEGKTQRRPLALLQAVIALGALREERGVEVARLVELLWADEAAVDPKASFDTALARLRKWLGVDGALKITDGRLSLNARLVWCDVNAFEHLCDALQQAVAPHADAHTLPRLLARLEALYRGKLFGGAALDPWSVAARERLALRFARAVGDAGALLEMRQRWDEALRLYEAALLQDMLAEPIHRALMRCLLARGQRADALRAFERCRSVLAAELGVAPSAETRRLIESSTTAG